VIPISENLDTVGPFGRTVADAVLGLSAIAGEDETDAFTMSVPRPPGNDYSKFLSSKTALNGAKFGLPWNRCWDFVPEDRREVANKLVDAIVQHGGEVIRTDFPCAGERIRSDGQWDW
jgi:amidase